jgi:radical SAM-linked protein
LTTIIETATARGITLPEFGQPVDLSLSPFLQAENYPGDSTPDCQVEPQDLPVLTQVFGRRPRKAAFTRRLTSVPKRRLRIQYAKKAKLRFFSHLDMVRVVERAIRRSQVPVAYSSGYHPRPKISFGPPLPWGAISRAEYFDMVLDTDYESAHVASLKARFPEGLEIVQTLALPAKAVSLFERINLIRYRVGLPSGGEGWDERIQEFLNHESVWFERTTEKNFRRIDIRPFVQALRIDRTSDAIYLEMDISVTNRGTVRPAEVVSHLGTPEHIDPRGLLFERMEVFIQEGSRRTSPMEFA